MAALTANALIASRGNMELHRYQMAVSTTLWAGSLVMLNSGGLAVPAVVGAGNRGIVGVAQEKVVSAATGTSYVLVGSGEFLVTGASLVDADIGSMVFASDDATVSGTQALNEPEAGMLAERVSATSGWVKVGPQFKTNVT